MDHGLAEQLGWRQGDAGLKRELASENVPYIQQDQDEPRKRTSFVPDTVGTPICDLFKTAVEPESLHLTGEMSRSPQ